MGRVIFQVKKMALIKQKSDSRVMVFIDLRNVTASVNMFSEVQLEVDFEEMVNLLVCDRNLRGAYVFDGVCNKVCSRPRSRLHQRLEEAGFRLVLRSQPNSEEESKEQKEVDVSLATTMCLAAFRDNYDTAILVSGDRDFVPAIETVHELGKIVEVASFERSLSNSLRVSADMYHSLDTMAIMTPVVRDAGIGCNMDTAVSDDEAVEV